MGDAPNLQLDDLLAQLVDHAEQMRSAHDRLRGLMRANSAVVTDLGLAALLQRIVEEACQLVDAPFGALGVIAPDGNGLEEFIHAGMDDATVATIGRLPEGKGLLGALIEDPRPIRLREIREDIRSVGFPEGHPPLSGFLGVPIRVRGDVFGNLYLASLSEADFTAEDEELVTALAATAGVAIENARLFEEAQQRQVWLEASTSTTRDLLTAEGSDALRLIASRVAELADADVVTLVLPVDDDTMRVETAVGRAAELLVGRTYPIAGTITAGILRTEEPVRVDDATALYETQGVVLHQSEFVPVGPVMGLPLAGAHRVRGVLMVGRVQGRRPFAAADLDMATTFAHQASVALEIADGRRDAQRMNTIEDRARIARDLHDHVIQQLFAAEMTLQSAAMRVADQGAAERIEQVVDTIDHTIKQIRSSIFQLRPRSAVGSGARNALLDIIAELEETLPSKPEIQFSGPVDTVCDAALLDDASAVVRETVTNVARHAGATHVVVSVEASASTLRIGVEDDGRGIGPARRRSGLANLQARAEERGGRLEVRSPATTHAGTPAGTSVTWTVPTGAPGASSPE